MLLFPIEVPFSLLVLLRSEILIFEYGNSVSIRNIGPTCKITHCYNQQVDKANHQYHLSVCFVSETTDHNLLRLFILKLEAVTAVAEKCTMRLLVA
jgi:hypothetical protein